MSGIRRFIAIIEAFPLEKQTAFVDWLTSNGYAWSHWYRDAWFIASVDNSVTASAIDAKLRELGDAKLSRFVFELPIEPDWAGAVTADLKNGAIRWLRDSWAFNAVEPEGQKK